MYKKIIAMIITLALMIYSYSYICCISISAADTVTSLPQKAQVNTAAAIPNVTTVPVTTAIPPVTVVPEVTSVPNVTTVPETTTTINPDIAATLDDMLKNPNIRGMLSNQELYEQVLAYLNDNAELKTDGNAVLIGNDQVDGGNKVMYTITTRDGSIFYVVIDLAAKKGENVYFLNKVDPVDLNAILESQSGTKKATSGTEVSGSGEVITDENGNVSEVTSDNRSVKDDGKKTVKKSSGGSFIYILMLIVGGGIIAGYYFLKIKPKKSGKSQDFSDDDDFEEDDEPSINEDDETTEETEDSYYKEKEEV